MPLCSVVIPWHRNLDDLRRAVGSVLAQDEGDFEIIVVANGVDDATFEAARAISNDPRYHLLRNTRAGAQTARNRGMAHARGKLIFLLDGDDGFHPDKLSRFLELQAREGFDVAFSRGTRVRGDGVTWPWPIGHWDGRQPLAEFFFCDGNLISTSAIVVTAEARGRIRFCVGVDTFHDPDFMIRAEHLGLSIKMLPEALYDWHDDRTGERISQSRNWRKRLVWIDKLPSNVSERARAAFRARCVAQHVFPGHFFSCLRFFAAAATSGAIPPKDVALFMVRGFIPEQVRRRLVNRFFLGRASKYAMLGQGTRTGLSASASHEAGLGRSGGP
jgi:glycosyltransferase involved in cell wall biosynthesis